MRKPLRWFGDTITVPPFSDEAAREAGALLEVVSLGGVMGMPHCRALPSIGRRCFEIRVNDRNQAWRIVCHVADEAVVILDVFSKKSRGTPRHVIHRCKQRLKHYERNH